MEALNGLISEYATAKKRRFTGKNELSDVILTTWKDYRDLTTRQITCGEVTMMGSGMRVKDGDLRELLSIRTWRELLFCLDIDEVSRENAAKELAESNLREVLKRYYEGGAPWQFRIECRSKEPGGAQPLYQKTGRQPDAGDRRHYAERYVRL